MGIVMYELITGELPFKGDNAVEIALKHLKEPISDIRSLVNNVPNSIVNIIKKATAKNPKNRYNDAREMHEDLKTALDDSRVLEPIISFKYSESDKLLIILAFIFTGLIVGITSIVVLIPLITNERQETIPEVTGLTVTEAIDKLQEAGFNVADKQEEVSSNEIEKGKVVKTNPAIGSKRKSGTEITIYVSLGDTQIAIEDYTGKSYLEIKGKLEALGLYVLVEKKNVEDGHETDYEDSKIIDQSVKANEKLSVGDTITLYIPNVISKYPNFKDGTFTISDVQDFADTYELKLDIEYVPTDQYEAGTIFYQSRPEGYTIVAGQSFKIKVAQALENDPDEGDDDCDGLC